MEHKLEDRQVLGTVDIFTKLQIVSLQKKKSNSLHIILFQEDNHFFLDAMWFSFLSKNSTGNTSTVWPPYNTVQ